MANPPLESGGSYCFRIRVPNDLLAFYAPKREIKVSLRTTDRREAAHLCRFKALEVTSEFELKLHQFKTAHGKNRCDASRNGSITCQLAGKKRTDANPHLEDRARW